MNPPDEDHRDRAQDALEAARAGLGLTGDDLENAKLYAMIGIGEGVLCVYDILIKLRDRSQGQ